MKDKELRIRMDSDFEEKVEYLKEINGYKNKSDTIRRTVEKEYRKETIDTECNKMFPNCQDCSQYEKCEEKAYKGLFGKGRKK